MKKRIIQSKKWVTMAMISAVILLYGCLHDARDQIFIGPGKLVDNHSLIYQVDVKLERAGDIFIEYFNAGDSISLYTSIFENTDHAVFHLIGLKPESEYNYVVHARIGDDIIQGDIGQFQSGALPVGLPDLKLKKNNYSFDGYILLKTFFDPGALLMIDSQAEVVWYHVYDQTTVRAFNFSPDQRILTLTDSSTIEYLNLFSETQGHINTRSHGFDKLHHDILMDSSGITFGLTYNYKILDLTSKGGQKKDTVMGDGIVAFSPEGKRIWDWNIFDHADPLKDDSINYLKDDWSHANTINLDADGNLILSFRNLNQIWKIDRETGRVVWKVGMHADFTSMVNELDFLHQHDVHINRYGHLMMFDNGINNRGFSRVLSVKLDESKKHWEPVLNIPLDKDHHTFRMGSARYIDDHHILISSPKRQMQISIIDETGKIVWNALSNKSSYRAIYINSDIIRHKKWF